MNIRLILFGFAFAAIFLVLLFFTLNSRNVTDDNYSRWLSATRTAYQAGIAADVAILTLRIRKRSNDDGMNLVIDRLYAAENELQTLSALEPSLLNPVLDLDSGFIVEILQQKRTLILGFQAERTALNASSAEVWRAIEELLGKPEVRGSLTFNLALMRLKEITLADSSQSPEQAREALNTQLEAITSEFAPIISSYKALWSNIEAEAKSVLQHTNNLDAIVDAEDELRNRLMGVNIFFDKIHEEHHLATAQERFFGRALVLELLLVSLFYLIRSRSLALQVEKHMAGLEDEVAMRTSSLANALDDLQKSAEEKDKLAAELRVAHRLEAIGQLAAGIAHEINTPAQFVGDNLKFLSDAYSDQMRLQNKYEEVLMQIADRQDHADLLQSIEEVSDEIDVEFLNEETPLALENSLEGVKRISKIVKSMKEFTHPGSEGMQDVDINKSLETTLVVAKNEWRYVATIEKEFDENLPQVAVFSAELNQVLLNIIVNSAHAIDKQRQDTGTEQLGCIHIKTSYNDDFIVISLRDNGCGIPQENIDRIFDPFFTTKEVGKGTGQGLSIARKIVCDKHRGQLEVQSDPGQFTEFNISLPRRRDDESHQGSDIELLQAS